MYIYICVCIYVYTYIYVHIHIHIHIYMHVCIYIYACIYTCTLRRLPVERVMILNFRMIMYHIDGVKLLRLNLYIFIRTYVFVCVYLTSRASVKSVNIQYYILYLALWNSMNNAYNIMHNTFDV